MRALYDVMVREDCSLCEVNPLVVTKGNDVVALDAKINLDDNAEFRHPEWRELEDRDEEDPVELEAKAAGLNYVSLDGNVGCLVNGAGLAMATMDIIKHFGAGHGVAPANFLDVGGGANQEQVTKAFKMILKSPKVKAIFVNIFGGIMKCDVIADGVVAAAKELGLKVPLVVPPRGDERGARAEDPQRERPRHPGGVARWPTARRRSSRRSRKEVASERPRRKGHAPARAGDHRQRRRLPRQADDRVRHAGRRRASRPGAAARSSRRKARCPSSTPSRRP